MQHHMKFQMPVVVFLAAAITTAIVSLTDGASADAQASMLSSTSACVSQVWPNIDAQCLGSVSDQLIVRKARAVAM